MITQVPRLILRSFTHVTIAHLWSFAHHWGDEFKLTPNYSIHSLIFFSSFFFSSSTQTMSDMQPKSISYVVRHAKNQWPVQWQQASPDRYWAWEMSIICQQQKVAHSLLAITSLISLPGAGKLLRWYIDCKL